MLTELLEAFRSQQLPGMWFWLDPRAVGEVVTVNAGLSPAYTSALDSVFILKAASLAMAITVIMLLAQKRALEGQLLTGSWAPIPGSAWGDKLFVSFLTSIANTAEMQSLPWSAQVP